MAREAGTSSTAGRSTGNSDCFADLLRATGLWARVRFGVIAALLPFRYAGLGEENDVFSPFETDQVHAGAYPAHVMLRTCTGSLARIPIRLDALRLVRLGGPGVKMPGLLSRRGDLIHWTPSTWWSRRGCPDFEVDTRHSTAIVDDEGSDRSRRVCVELADGGHVGLVCHAALPEGFFAATSR